MRILSLSLLLSLGLMGCADSSKSDFPVRSQAVQQKAEELSDSVTVVRLSADNVDAFNVSRSFVGSRASIPSGEWDYRIGVGDVLDVVVWDHPELTMPAGERRTPSESGLRVQADGTFFYPYVGQIRAKGMSPSAVRADLAEKLTKFIPDPQVEVRVVEYKSQAVSVTGEVKKPLRQPLTDVSLTLLDAIDAAGGLTEEADARAVTIRRGGRSYQVDLDAFLADGVAANNPTLRGGDVVSVGRAKVQEAYLLGQLVKQSTVDLSRENVTLTQALTRVGGLKETNADSRGVFVFRDGAMGVTVYQLDVSNPTAYLVGANFEVHPRDVIYVTTAPLYRWNRLISSLLPTLTSVRTADQISAN